MSINKLIGNIKNFECEKKCICIQIVGNSAINFDEKSNRFIIDKRKTLIIL